MIYIYIYIYIQCKNTIEQYRIEVVLRLTHDMTSVERQEYCGGKSLCGSSGWMGAL